MKTLLIFHLTQKRLENFKYKIQQIEKQTALRNLLLVLPTDL